MRRLATSGSAVIEFAVLAPIMCLFLFGIIETGVIFYAQSTLQNAADDAARMVRTGQMQSQGMSETQFVAQICTEMSGLMSTTTCNANMQIDMRAFSSFASANFGNVTKANGSIDTTKLQFAAGGACDVVLIRAFFPWTIMTPLMAPFLQNMPNGQYLLAAADSFRNEPYTSTASC
ncbi:MAG TPA: TadE/TadG family type IV pilus assembly protein [Rhizomicrobium sp.]|jgi:Flp pilus assembly protein TadG